MGRKCSVKSCTSDSTKPEHTGVTFHKVPRHPDVRPKWLSLCKMADNKSTAKLLFVCSRHFLRADFCSFKGKKYMLRQGVLPSVFPWDKSRLEAIMAEVSGKKDDNEDKESHKASKKQEKAKDIKTEVPAPASIVEPEITELKVEPKEEKFEEPEEVKQEINAEIVENVEVKEEIDEFDKHQMTQEAPSTPTSINFVINSRIEVLDNNNFWYPAKINEVDYEENEILIHFEKFSNKYDEWISMSSPRLRPLQPRTFETYAVGERCMAVWCDSRKFPATVTKIVDNETYEVLFDDGFVKTVKNHKMFKMNVAKPAQASPLFDPVRGTKQERRDKKRKLNVAALFGKRARLSHQEDKRSKSIASSNAEESYLSPASQDEANASDTPIETWRPKWDNGRPVGIESTIDSIDGLRKSVIVADPRLPVGWCKHLSQRMYGNSAGKWDAIIVAPDGKKFRTKTEIKNYLDLHPSVEATLEMFDFSIYRNSRKRTPKVAKPKAEPLESSPQEEETPVEEPPAEPEPQEEPPVSLKIIFENDAYKCPIEGCGKNFRRENLALMHVKHYHSEYTKYLDNTPNVADLAYARTVGENLDRSPGPAKSNSSSKATPQDKTAAAPRAAAKTHVPNEAKVEDAAAAPEGKSNNSEIIKLLNQKPPDVSKDIQPLPSGLPSNMYPEINLKDLLEKSDEISMRADINIKSLCTSRPTQGIKTLLPVRPPKDEGGEEKPGSKRKRMSLDNVEAAKGKTSQPEHSTQPPTPPPPAPPSLPLSPPPLPPSPPPVTVATPLSAALELEAPPSVAMQFESVIIEGGKIIKLERMKQEEIINCTCGFTEEDGLMIQCELCLCWQHAYCNNIVKESEVPEKYVCYICQHPLLERTSAKYLHDQDWLKQGVLPVASYHTKDQAQLSKRFEKLNKCSDLSGGLLELREYMHTLGVKLKIAEARNHPKLYLWSKPWEKPRLPEKAADQEELNDVKQETDHQYIKSDLDKGDPRSDSMLMMILKSDKEHMPMLNMHNSMEPIIPRPEAAIDSDDCRLNLLEHISHAENLVEERLEEFEKRLDVLEEGMNVEMDGEYPRTRQTLQLLTRDLETIRKFGELPLI